MGKLHDKNVSTTHEEEEMKISDRSLPPGTPRWVKVLLIIVIVLVLLFIIMKLTGIGGEHGPGRHFSSDDSGHYKSFVQHGLHLS